MKIHQQLISIIKDQSGVTAILVAIVLAMLLGFTALAVDIGYVMTTKNELQNVADAAALAATRQLGAIYQGMSHDDQQTYVCDPSTIIPIAKDVAGKNKAGAKNITINDDDLIIGQWDGDNLTPTLAQPDAVEVTARRDGASAQGPITTFFARILGINTVDVSADATAALTGQGTAGPGDLELPIGISSFFFQQDNFCNEHIQFSPTNDPDSCAGWTTFHISPSNDITIRRILQELDGYQNQETVAGKTEYEFIGGDLSTPTFDALLMLFKEKGYDVFPGTYNPVETTMNEDNNEVPVTDTSSLGVPLFDDDGVTRLYYPDGTPRNHHVWETTVVVYDWPDCSNPNTIIEIVGFSTVTLTDVEGPPDKTLIGEVKCDQVNNDLSRGSGSNYGTKGSIPGLVE
jgi:hypothetical protein